MTLYPWLMTSFPPAVERNVWDADRIFVHRTHPAHSFLEGQYEQGVPEGDEEREVGQAAV